MNIAEIMAEAPTKQEIANLSSEDKLWMEFDLFYESGEPHSFIAPSGKRIGFGTNHEKGEFTLLIDWDVVVSTPDAHEIVKKAIQNY